MTPALLTEAGVALYGSRWQSDLALVLSVSDRTVRRWVAGDNAIPPGVAADLAKVLRGRSSYTARLAAEVDSAAKPR